MNVYGTQCPLGCAQLGKPDPRGQVLPVGALGKDISKPTSRPCKHSQISLAVLFLKVNIAPQRKSTLIIMSQSEMSTSPLGAENTAAVKVQQGPSGHRLLPVWPDPHDASGLGTP